MKAKHLIAATAFGVLVLSSCAQPSSEKADTPPVTEAAAPSGCAAVANRNWTAHINAMPGPNAQRTLIVAGEVDLPTPGYTVALNLGPADRSAMPVQQLILNTTAPSGVVAQVVTPYPVNYTGLAIAEHYTAVRIMCGGAQLAEITEIVTAQ